ncbi:hypothetical protein [Legionella waltersii]|uniref:Transmembrane protein n=1 Tax=Legionella waltersii TaxID=66969 RepID=A0A0W1A1R3_9GAMM|nr:hypothetical protein [Legionella waltersii]KTD75072.1 transmembrane protein [Legionella waltersii]SNV05256.1 transmembrane protein [Legionella waltersii]
MNNTNQNDKLFILGIICLVLALGLLFFSLYILPYIIWEFNYDVPDFILTMINDYQGNYSYSQGSSKAIVWLYFFIPSLIFGYISYYISNYIDKNAQDLQNPTEEESKEPTKNKESLKESASLGIKLLSIIVLIFAVVFILQEFFAVTS